MVSCTIDETVYRCGLCETLFEAGVADDTGEGSPRCPQCGFMDAAPAEPGDKDVVIRRTTKFR